MKVPIRPAPPPPVNQPGSKGYSTKDNRNKSSNIPKKKPPPPRPPPPKFTNKRQVPARPSQLITNLFHRKNNQSTSSKVIETQITRSTAEFESKNTNNVLTLIDFNSPPSSPTFTTRSSSDALSVNSFGSDGVTPCSTSSGNTSNVESGFEDDFDFFSSSSSSSSLNKNTQKDPWDAIQQRPKNPSPLAFPQNQSGNTKRNTWVTFSSNSNRRPQSENVSAMPTIIRVKPDRPPKPPSIQKVTSSHVDLLTDVFESVNFNSNNGIYYEDDDEDDWSPSESPPMPTCPPPPAPPPEFLNGIEDASKPYGIALYNYEGAQPEDLSFKEHDIINLVRRIDENWYLGEINGKEGSVPVNFISVRVPVPEDGFASDRYVTALYQFIPETWEDLDFKEGAIIKVISRIDQDWLYGECDGKTGQFPANFVDRIPHDLPVKRN